MVATGSMAPSVPAGSLGVVRPAAGGSVRPGEVVSFRAGTLPGPVLHRVAAVVEVGGVQYLQTKGDANRSADPRLVRFEDVRGRLVVRLAGVGRVVEPLSGPAGPAVLVGVPLLALVAAERRARRRPVAAAAPNVPGRPRFVL